MARAKGWIWISLALVCALSAGGLTYFLLQRQSVAAELAVAEAQQLAAPAPVETITIPVAVRDLERGQVLSAQDFALKAFPLDLAPSSAITDTELLADQILAEHVGQGDIFRASALYGGTGAPLSSEIAAGRTVIAFPTGDLLSGSGLFVEGDRVDLMLSTEVVATAEGAPDIGAITGYTVQNVRIMRLLSPQPTEENPNPAPEALLLEMDPADAVMLKKVKDANGVIDLALRSPVDNEAFQVGPITDSELIQLMDSYDAPATVGNAP